MALDTDTLTTLPQAPRLEMHRPPTHGPMVDRAAIARFRQQLVPPTAVQEPTVLAIDLEGRFPVAGVLIELVVPLVQDARSGRLGPVAVVICSSDEGVRDTLRALAYQHRLALFVAPSVEQLGEAEPVGDLTETDLETLETLRRLGGRVTVASFATETGLGAPAATNRLVNLQQKGYLQRVDRPRRAGVVYLDPRAAAPTIAPAALPPEIGRELAIFAAVAGTEPDQLLAVAWSEWVAAQAVPAHPSPPALLDAWRDYRRRHAGELSEGLRWAQTVLADPTRASVEASGMSDEDLAALREAFE